MRRHFKNEKGAITVIVAMSLVVLLGMTSLVTDVGYLYFRKRNLQNAADAAALAAAWEALDGSSMARDEAEKYVTAHGLDPATNIREFLVSGATVSVELEAEEDLFFARVLGFQQSTVVAKAVATLDFEGSIIPLASLEESFVVGDYYLLKVFQPSHWSFGPGNFAPLALDGVGAKNYNDQVKYGYEGTIKVGDFISTEPGNMSGPTKDAIQYRLDNNLLEVVVPIVINHGGGGRHDLEVIGFAAFTLDPTQPPGSGNENLVWGKFTGYWGAEATGNARAVLIQ